MSCKKSLEYKIEEKWRLFTDKCIWIRASMRTAKFGHDY